MRGVDLLDMLLKRYSNIDYVMNLDFQDGIDLINKATEKVDEERHWDVWLIMYTNMTEQTYKSFDEWYKDGKRDQLQAVEFKKQSTEDVLEMVAKIKEADMKAREESIKAQV